MKSILFLRHAKSSWKDRYITDQKRKLSKIGFKQLDYLGNYLIKKRISIDLTYVSDSIRAIETVNYLKKKINLKTKNIVFSKKMYLIDEIIMANLIKKISDKYNNLLIVNHEPCIRGLFHYLVKNNDNSINKFSLSIPTSSLIILRSDLQKWSNLKSAIFEISEYYT